MDNEVPTSEKRVSFKQMAAHNDTTFANFM